MIDSFRLMALKAPCQVLGRWTRRTKVIKRIDISLLTMFLEELPIPEYQQETFDNVQHRT